MTQLICYLLLFLSKVLVIFFRTTKSTVLMTEIKIISSNTNTSSPLNDLAKDLLILYVLLFLKPNN